MAETVERIKPEEARKHLGSGDAVLVCAYEDEAKCRENRLDGALTLHEFRGRQQEIPRDREIIFY